MVAPKLCGVSAVKLPVRSLDASRSWYDDLFGYTVELEFPDDDGVVRGIAGHLDGVRDTWLALRQAPEVAAALAGFNLVNWAVEDRDQVQAWIDRLDHLDIAHSPLIDATIGWMVVLHDPDGHELHLYSRQPHARDHSTRPGYGRAVAMPSPPSVTPP